MCVHQVRGPLCPAELSYERGRAMPLYRGATSKVILAHLSHEELAELTRHDGPALRRAGLPRSVEALAQVMAQLRAERVCTTAGEVDPNARGWAVAIHHGRHLLGSLSVVMSSDAEVPDPQRVGDQVMRAGLRIEGRLR